MSWGQLNNRANTMTQKVTVAVDLPIGLIEQDRGNSGRTFPLQCLSDGSQGRHCTSLLFTPSVSFPLRLSELFI